MAPSVVEWNSRFSITWDACSKYVGGAGRESLFEMQSMDFEGGDQSKGAVTLVVGLANAFEKLHFSVVWLWAGIDGTMWAWSAREKGDF